MGWAERKGGGRNDGWACRRVAHPIPGWTPGRPPRTTLQLPISVSLPRPSVPATASVAADRNYPPPGSLSSSSAVLATATVPHFKLSPHY
jgi:hypothetical protein